MKPGVVVCYCVYRVNKSKTDYSIKIMLQQLVADNFAKDRENVKRELRLNIVIFFTSLSDVLRLRDVSKVF